MDQPKRSVAVSRVSARMSERRGKGSGTRTREGAEHQNVQIILRASAIFRFLSEEHVELSLTEIAERLGAYPSGTLRLLQSLTDEGLLSRSASTGNYRLGPRIIELAGVMFSRMSLLGTIRPTVERLSQSLRETVAVSVYQSGTVTYVDCVEPSYPIKYSVRIGASVPATWVASGQAMLAGMPEEAERLLGLGQPLRRHGEMSAEAFRAELSRIARRGYALDRGHYLQSLGSAAAAVRGHLGRPLASVTIISDRRKFEGKDGQKLGEIVRAAADDMSRQLGAGRESSPRKGGRRE